MTQSSDRELPFDITPEVSALAGSQELRLLARMAADGPFECIMCGQEGTASKATAAAVIIRGRRNLFRDGTGTTAPQNRDLVLLRLAHRIRARLSRVLDSGEVMEPGAASVGVSTAVLMVRGVPRPLLLLDFVSGLGALAGPDDRVDLVVSKLLEAGMTLVSDLAAPLP